jgi:hypothetical protein
MPSLVAFMAYEFDAHNGSGKLQTERQIFTDIRPHKTDETLNFT